MATEPAQYHRSGAVLHNRAQSWCPRCVGGGSSPSHLGRRDGESMRLACSAIHVVMVMIVLVRGVIDAPWVRGCRVFVRSLYSLAQPQRPRDCSGILGQRRVAHGQTACDLAASWDKRKRSMTASACLGFCATWMRLGHWCEVEAYELRTRTSNELKDLGGAKAELAKLRVATSPTAHGASRLAKS